MEVHSYLVPQTRTLILQLRRHAEDVSQSGLRVAKNDADFKCSIFYCNSRVLPFY